jgi:hypothetical protein
MSRTFLAAIVCVLMVAVSSQAAKVKVWQQNTAANYDKAQLKNAVVSSEGTLRLSRQLKPLTGLDASHVWDVIEDKDGSLIAATGDEGKIYKITADGKATLIYKADDSQILCLAAGSDGSVYAGTGPSGQIIRIDAQGQANVFCETGETYVWSLVQDSKSQTLYAGTGPKGRILRITPEGKASVFYSTKQDHILCLASGPNGTLYAGTDKGGLVYRIDAKGKGFVLYQAVQGEIRCLKVTNDAVYAGTSSPTKRRGGASAASSSSPLPTAALDSASKDTDTVKTDLLAKGADKTAVEKGPSSDSKEPSKGSPAPAPSTPSVGENSVYRIAFDGSVREVFREKALILCLARNGNRLLIGTGMDGQLFEVEETTKERAEIARLDHGQILALCKRHDGSLVVAAGDPGKLYALQDKFAAKGTITSEVFDAKLISKWGSLRWQAETPDGTSVRVAVRSGNVAEPDETWSDWSAEQTDGQQATIAAPAARFLQYRVTLVTTNPSETPALRTIALRYMTANQAPEVTKLDVPDLNAVNLENPKKLKIKWTATDANEDELTYSLFVRKDGWKNWVQLEEDLEKTDFEWDTTTTPSGVYQIKVVASDRKDNPDEEALTGERVSVPFVVCHTPPTVTVKTTGIDGDQVQIEATSVSPLARITSASFAVNGKKWNSVFPVNGLFDSKEETFKFKTEGLKPGTYVLVLKVRDAAGNTGSGDVVFTVQPHK